MHKKIDGVDDMIDASKGTHKKKKKTLDKSHACTHTNIHTHKEHVSYQYILRTQGKRNKRAVFDARDTPYTLDGVLGRLLAQTNRAVVVVR